ncbi:uncharacterized protein BJX67DRAFT_144865 [Aspergillus lucknowensis]|uniref:Proteophosphoglycan 5 n=1 Tax=Aspergillus lucknowensis TaxID=176173 RepID=A0ABR4LP42_9EURO
MSTLSHTPLTPKGPRNNRRNQKRNTTPSTQNASTFATPPSSPARTVSPREVPSDSSCTITLSKKKGIRSSKKPRDVARASPVNKPDHRHTSHPNNNITNPHLKDTHYAGPTFHASPAPSTLPIPSFISKSFPESDLAPTVEHDSDSFDTDADLENTPSKPKSRPSAPQEERESTPLDFLFKAAVDARNRPPQRNTEPSPKVRSPQTDSKTIQQRRPNSDITGMFPLELGTSDLCLPQIGPSFAPSYKDRMNALRSASSPSPALRDLNEDERKAKTEALKTLLLNPRPQRPSSVAFSPGTHLTHNPDQPALSPVVPHFATPTRTSTGPSGSSSHGLPGKPPFQPGSRSLSGFNDTHSNPPQHSRYQDTTFESGILVSNPGNAPSTPRQAYGSPSGVHIHSKPLSYQQIPARYPESHSQSPAAQNAPANASVFDTKKMEDDLRRILKLDANTSIPSDGIQSSFA